MIAGISEALLLQKYDTNHRHYPHIYHSNFPVSIFDTLLAPAILVINLFPEEELVADWRDMKHGRWSLISQ